MLPSLSLFLSSSSHMTPTEGVSTKTQIHLFWAHSDLFSASTGQDVAKETWAAVMLGHFWGCLWSQRVSHPAGPTTVTSVHRAEVGSTRHTWTWGREDGSPRGVGLATGCALLSDTFLPPMIKLGCSFHHLGKSASLGIPARSLLPSKAGWAEKSWGVGPNPRTGSWEKGPCF